MGRALGKPPGRSLTEAVRLDGGAAWTWSANPGSTVYGETVRKVKHGEWRRWDPRRSKVGSGLLRTTGAPERLLPAPGDHVLYLGAGHGTTVSHVHDVVCHDGAPGRVVAVDLSPRCLRDLTRLAHQRQGLVPVLGDARRPEAWRAVLPRRATWVFQDVAQAHQASIFTSACERFLAPAGRGLLSLKVESDRGTDADALRTKVEHELAEAGLALEEVIDLEGFEDKHLLFVVGRPPRA
ncbi:MAG: fibrillarin-like rRNA/tRNA 2'-O-methyltransferase [Candidatus Poseidoniaceae archaeon]